MSLTRRGAAIASVAVVAVLVLLVGGAVYGAHLAGGLFTAAPDYTGSGTGSVVVQVHPGDSAAAIGATLEAADVVKSQGAFVDAAKSDSRSMSIAPGFYRLHHHMSGKAALAMLLDPKARVQAQVVVPEGFRVEQVLQRVAAATRIPLAQLQQAVASPASIGLPSYAKGTVEGFLFPATYDFEPGTTAVQALASMVQRFEQEAGAVGLVDGAAALGRTPFDVVTVASLVEREARVPADYPKVARVIYNRLKAGMPLQLDSTVNYALHANKTRVTIADTKVASPYNTYLHPGLPPTPICSPGARAIEAALHPADGSWLYFVTMDDAGHNAFATSYDDFLRLKAQAERQRSQ